MPPEPFISEDLFASISSSMQYAFSSCESIREIHFPTFESLIAKNYDVENTSKEVTESFKKMLNLAVNKVIGETV